MPISVCLMAHKMHPLTSVFDTGARPNIIVEDILETERLKSIQANSSPSLRNATNQKLSAVEAVTLYIKISDSRIRVPFGFVRNLALKVLLETSFIGRFVKSIFRLKQNTVPYNSRPVLILAINDLSE